MYYRPICCTAFSALAFSALHASALAAQEVGEPLQSIRLENLSACEVLAIFGRRIDAGRFDEAQVLLERLAADQTGRRRASSANFTRSLATLWPPFTKPGPQAW